MIKDISFLLGEMGSGNFVITSKAADVYIGDFTAILESFRQIRDRLSGTLLQINASAEQIAAGASQVSDGAQALAQGATEQASSVEELVRNCK